MRIILLILALAVASGVEAFNVPDKSTVLKGYYERSAELKLQNTFADNLEGVWYYPEEDMTLVIERLAGERNSKSVVYQIVVCECEDLTVDIGSIAGYLETTAVPEEFKLWLYSGFDGDLLAYPIECLATMTGDNQTLKIAKPKIRASVSVNIMRFFPSIFGGGIRIYPHIDNPKATPGFIRWNDKTKKKPIYF